MAYVRLVLSCFVIAGALSPRPAHAQERRPPPPRTQLPPAQLGLWLDGIHKVDGHPEQQVDTHHFCMTPERGPIQCALFSGFGTDAKLIGVEYIIDANTFASLPAEEKRLWHSHVFEVTSGALVLPGMSEREETAFLQNAINTYGKTWHTWSEHRGATVPIGRPELMLSLTRNEELRPELLQQRDRTLGTNTQQLRAARARTITQLPKVLPGADVGEGGRSCEGPPAPARARRAPPPR